MKEWLKRQKNQTPYTCKVNPRPVFWSIFGAIIKYFTNETYLMTSLYRRLKHVRYKQL
jgi:hypothetical protein